MRLLILMFLTGCAPLATTRAIRGSWHLETQTADNGREIPLEEKDTALLIGWFTAGFEFRANGVLFGLIAREGQTGLFVNRGQKGRYHVPRDEESILLKDDIFGEAFGVIEEPLHILDLDGDDILLVEDDDGRTYRFVRPAE